MSKEENETTEEILIAEVNSESIYQQDRALVDMQVATARAYPRNLKKSVENAIATVTLDRETASTCTYALPRGGKNLTGPSVHLAKILCQTWGNMRAEAKVIDIGQKHITSQAIAFDLENNVAIKVEVKRSIMTRNGRMNDDMITVTGNAANSIALRNAILSVIPRNVVDKVYKSALNTITGKIDDKQSLIAQRKRIFEAIIDSYNVTEKQILEMLGRVSDNHVTAEDLVVLVGVGQAIKDGDTSIEDAFKPKQKGKSVQQQETERILKLINEAPSTEILESYKEHVIEEFQLLYDTKMNELKIQGK